MYYIYSGVQIRNKIKFELEFECIILKYVISFKFYI